jgi:hypothetical protein
LSKSAVNALILFIRVRNIFDSGHYLARCPPQKQISLNQTILQEMTFFDTVSAHVPADYHVLAGGHAPGYTAAPAVDSVAAEGDMGLVAVVKPDDHRFWQ